MNKPPMRDQFSLRNYIENRRCLVESESAFAYHKEDLVTLRPGRDHSFVDALVERMLRSFHCRPLQVRFDASKTNYEINIYLTNIGDILLKGR